MTKTKDYQVKYTFVYTVQAASIREAEKFADELLRGDSDTEYFLDMLEDCAVTALEKTEL